MKRWVKARLADRPTARRVIGLFRHRPLLALPFILYSVYLTFRLTRKFLPLRVIVVNRLFRVDIHVARDSCIEIDAPLLIESYQGGSTPTHISVGQTATLKVCGEFVVGHGVQIVVAPSAMLTLGGRKTSSGSGITCESRIMVAREVSIGHDSIIAWGVFITDSDWHFLDGEVRQSAVDIGSHVWISHDVSVLRGARIGNGCVIGAKSVVRDQEFAARLLIAGVPARVIRKGVNWAR